jgi:predicted NAD-dependent protein-ADP-ribosyltransferase YbiA (DUF1768 family)
MLDLLRIKFAEAHLAELLLATGEATLVEGNTWHDNDWGACTCEGCQAEPKHNLLGQLLMQVRSELRQGASQSTAEADGE